MKCVSSKSSIAKKFRPLLHAKCYVLCINNERKGEQQYSLTDVFYHKINWKLAIQIIVQVLKTEATYYYTYIKLQRLIGYG